MDVRSLTEDFAVSPQIRPEELPDIAAAGFRSVLCNRPDGEEPGQPDFDAIAAAAGAAGLVARSVPIVSGMLTPQAVEDFRRALQEMPRPILAYCRSGTRSTMLWAIARHGQMADEEILRCAARAGHDVSAILQQLGAR